MTVVSIPEEKKQSCGDKILKISGRVRIRIPNRSIPEFIIERRITNKKTGEVSWVTSGYYGSIRPALVRSIDYVVAAERQTELREFATVLLKLEKRIDKVLAQFQGASR